MASNLNYKAIIFYAILLSIVVLVVMYFLNIANFKVFVTGLTANFKMPDISGVTGIFDGVFQWVQANPLATTFFGFLGTTAVGYIIKNWQTNKLLDASTQKLAQTQADLSLVKDTAEQKASQTVTEIQGLKNELEVYKSDNTLGELNKAFLESGDRIKQLEAQLVEARSSSASTLEGLWAKSGGQVLEVAGVKYKIIEKEILTVK